MEWAACQSNLGRSIVRHLCWQVGFECFDHTGISLNTLTALWMRWQKSVEDALRSICLTEGGFFLAYASDSVQPIKPEAHPELSKNEGFSGGRRFSFGGRQESWSQPVPRPLGSQQPAVVFPLPLSRSPVYSGAGVHCTPRVRQIPFPPPWRDDRREQNPHIRSP